MKLLIGIGVVLLLISLIGLVRVGGVVEYSAEGLRVWMRLGAFRIQVFPRTAKAGRSQRPKNRKKKEKKAKKTAKDKETNKPKSGGPVELAKRFLPLIGEAAGGMKDRICIDDLEVFFTAGGRDAAKTAMTFGYSNFAIGMIWPIFEQNFEVKDYRIRTAMDFTAAGSTVWIRAGISARIHQLGSFAVIYGIKFFRAYLAGRKKAGNTQKG